MAADADQGSATSVRTLCRSVLGMVVVVVLAGCTGSTGVQDKLLQAAKDSQAAVASGSLALSLLDQGTSTRAVAETTFVDMTRQLSSAQKSLIELQLSSPDQERSRDATAAAVYDATMAVLAGRDCLQTGTPCAAAQQQLQRSGQRLDEVTTQLEEGR